MGDPRDSSIGQFFTKTVAPNLNPLDSSIGRLGSGLATGDFNKALGGASEIGKGLYDTGKQFENFSTGGLIGIGQNEQAKERRRIDDQTQNQARQREGEEAFAREQDIINLNNQAEQARKNKINTDYITNYNKGIADDEAMKALEDARNATRRKQGRTINFG